MERGHHRRRPPVAQGLRRGRRCARRTGAWCAGRPPGSLPSPRSRPTRSASTAPASTEASWSGSPTSTSRASGRTASSSRAISVSETIEVSSTTTTSYGSRLVRSCRNRAAAVGPPAEQPVERRGLEAVEPAWSRGLDGAVVGVTDSCTASCSRAAALPVGAASAMRGVGGRSRAVGDQGEQARHRGGLAGARAAGRAPSSTACGRRAAARAARVSCRRGTRRSSAASRAACPPSGGVRRDAVDQVVADLALLAPVAVEVEQTPDEAQHLLARPAGWTTRSTHAAGAGHGRLLGLERHAATVVEVDADRPVRTAAHRQRAASSTSSSVSPSRSPRRRATWTSAASSSPRR